MKHTLFDLLDGVSKQKTLFFPETIPQQIPHGDMPGDKIVIDAGHIRKAKVLMPPLVTLLAGTLEHKPSQRCVIGICGGSGVGKSETASLIGWYLRYLGVSCYILSGDNYPHRIPQYNDAERLRIFRDAGIRGLFSHGAHTKEIGVLLHELMLQDQDADPTLCEQYPWLSVYQAAGRNGLKRYLGTPEEIDFCGVSNIINQFQNGARSIMLKRLGRESADLWYELVDFSEVDVLIVEWTHSNSDFLSGVDVPILLNSTPEETLAHRKQRNRDGKTDSAFTTMVLEIEQSLLIQHAHKAKLILSKDGELLPCEAFCNVLDKPHEVSL